MSKQERLLAIYNQQLEVIRLERLLLAEMENGTQLYDCPSYIEYRKQMDILESLIP